MTIREVVGEYTEEEHYLVKQNRWTWDDEQVEAAVKFDSSISYLGLLYLSVNVYTSKGSIVGGWILAGENSTSRGFLGFCCGFLRFPSGLPRLIPNILVLIELRNTLVDWMFRND